MTGYWVNNWSLIFEEGVIHCRSIMECQTPNGCLLINYWDDSNKKRILTGCPPGVGLYTLTPFIFVKINPTNLIFCMNAFLRNSQGILWSKMWILNIYFESSGGQPVCSGLFLYLPSLVTRIPEEILNSIMRLNSM